MHLDGNLLSYGFGTGWKQRDPRLGAASLRVDATPADEDGSDQLRADDLQYDNGLFDHVQEVCSDAGFTTVEDCSSEIWAGETQVGCSCVLCNCDNTY
jgi:hypothetical protein